MTPCAPLARHSKEVSSVFDLLGHKENDLTAALAYTLARSPLLLGLMLRRLTPESGDEGEEVMLRLEEADSLGRTDLEISTNSRLIIIEAKRGWLLPGETQLGRYARRVAAHGGGILVSLSAASALWAQSSLPEVVEGIPIIHLPWNEVRTDLDLARTAARGQERTWLDEFSEYLRKAVKMRDPADSWTYCVSAGNGRPGDGGLRTFREFITTESRYFHPYAWGSGWPRTPPNFLAFRWDSHVQRAHRVTRAEVIPSLQDRWPDIPETEDTTRAFALYHLGPQLLPAPVPNGASYRASRMWVILDQLLTGPTLSEALHRTALITSGRGYPPASPGTEEA